MAAISNTKTAKYLYSHDQDLAKMLEVRFSYTDRIPIQSRPSCPAVQRFAAHDAGGKPANRMT